MNPRAICATAIAVIIILIVGIVLVVCLAPRRPPRVRIPNLGSVGTIAGTRIPKVMWTYWNSDTVSPFLKKCVGTWRRYHPEYQIIVMTPATLHLYMDPTLTRVPWNDSSARESDIIRVNVLAAYGGVWSDISMMLYGPCQPLQNVPAGTEFIGFFLGGFTTKPNSPVIESWWFATAPGGEFIVKWRDAFMHLHGTLSIAERVRRIEAEGVDLQRINESMKQYLFIHAAAQYVLQKNGPDVQIGMRMFKAEDGPFEYLCKNGWDSEKSIKWVLAQDQKPAMIKLRGVERKYAEQLL